MQSRLAACDCNQRGDVAARLRGVDRDAVAAAVRNIEPAVGSQGDAPREVQARVTPGDRGCRGDIPRRVRRKDRDAVTAHPAVPHVGDVEPAAGVHNDTLNVVQRRVAAGDRRYWGDVAGGIRREDVYCCGNAAAIDDVESTHRIAGDAPRVA